MDRNDADHRLWQHRPIHVEVTADAFVSVEPFLPGDVEVVQRGEKWVIQGVYGFDIFTEHRFTVRIGRELRTFRRYEDIPERFDNVIEFLPDPTHDITFIFSFERGGRPFSHSHWIHHDMDPWPAKLRELIARETNGGWTNASSHTNRRRRRLPLLRDGAPARVTRHLLQWDPDLAPE